VNLRPGAAALTLGALILGTSARSFTQGRLTFVQAGTIPGPVDLVRAQGSYVYLAESKTFVVVDASNVAAPKKLGEQVFPERIWGFRVAGDRAYVAAGHSGLGVIDISNPSSLKLLTMFKTPGQAKNVSVTGTKAFVANHNSGVDIVDLTDASKPTLLGSAFLDGYARDVAAVGSLAVAVDNPSGVYVFDAAAKTLDPITSIQSATAPQQIEIAEITGPETRRLAVLAGSEPYDPLRAVKLQAGGKPRGGAVQLVDVTNPALPVMAGTYATASSSRRLAVHGALVFVADGADGLQVLDVSTPSKAAPVGGFRTSKPARDVALANSLVFLAVGGPRPGVVGGARADGTDDSEVVILRQAP
jgi:hypothetical protein